MRSVVLCVILASALPLLKAEESRAQGPGIQALRSRLGDKSPEIRMEAARGLARVGGRQAVIILRDGLSDKNVDVRMTVIEALGFVGGQLALTVLSEALKDKSTQVRRAVEALRQAGTIAAIPIIEKAFDDKERAVRLRAALVLRRIGHRSGVPVLGRAALNDNDPSVRAAAAKHLGKVGVKDPRALGLLAKVLEDKEPAVRIRAVESLGFVQLPGAMTVLQQALEDPNAGVRLRATEVMGHVLAKDFE